ncbi:hypothetical protein Vafri_21385, partial [Volvox africanus]
HCRRAAPRSGCLTHCAASTFSRPPSSLKDRLRRPAHSAVAAAAIATTTITTSASARARHSFLTGLLLPLLPVLFLPLPLDPGGGAAVDVGLHHRRGVPGLLAVGVAVGLPILPLSAC